MPALVRYGTYARQLATRSNVSPYAVAGRLAQLGAKYGYRYVRRSMRKRKATRKTRTAKRRRTQARTFGESPRKPAPSKRLQKEWRTDTGASGVSSSTRVLSAVRLLDINRNDDGGNFMNERQKRTCKLSGMRFCAEIRNKDGIDTTRPKYVNIALLTDKETDGSTIAQSDFTGADLFRDFRDGSSRSRDFYIKNVDGTFSTISDLSSNEMHCLPINVDRYGILFHKRIRLKPNNGNFVDCRNVDFYVKLKRQLRWDQGADGSDNTYPEGNGVWLVMWCDNFQVNAQADPAENQLDARFRILTYFKDACTPC